ncbi:ABC transporter, periplasmic spermidine putrescine-binding protein PotD (TC 3.A.1.11.1) [Richelia intracellularis HM01]|uniref:extracellular solute-binding protein n=1 Tax=Richelia intracellularis TaxID=1164990 RepID=UPI0002B542D6|nr:extracellular solute-binding protein [Richelia intracellularis]CCH65284.1 ABC transporter, periplasmic spermidine putrescine-binding protein PotD (TC 3.A.1.11.1) [Richelia intracellularis HM01]
MNRRYFLQSVLTLATSQLALGCGSKQKTQFTVNLLKNSIPAHIINKFSQSLTQNIQLEFSPVGQLQTIFQELIDSQQLSKNNTRKVLKNPPLFWPPKSNKVADVVTLGNYWLDIAIKRGLIQPLDREKIPNWQHLPKEWQRLVMRNQQGKLDHQGQIWAAPYRWGTTMIVYRRDKFDRLGWKPQDWGDLWREELRDRISILDHPREVIGLVLKRLGKSYNYEDLEFLTELEPLLHSLHQQVKFYSSDKYLEALLMKDTWLAVGWSSDILRAIARNTNLAAVIPKSGTALWADMWACPYTGVSANINKEATLYQWINFCWQAENAKQIALLTKTNSPIPNYIKSDEIQKSLREISLNDQIFQKSEFIHCLEPTLNAKYESLFTRITKA